MPEKKTEEVKKKAGIYCTEFWLIALAEVVALLVASGVVPTEGIWPKTVALVVAALAGMGYVAGRSKVKKNGS